MFVSNSTYRSFLKRLDDPARNECYEAKLQEHNVESIGVCRLHWNQACEYKLSDDQEVHDDVQLPPHVATHLEHADRVDL